MAFVRQIFRIVRNTIQIFISLSEPEHGMTPCSGMLIKVPAQVISLTLFNKVYYQFWKPFKIFSFQRIVNSLILIYV